ncbi:MAG: hypothetical protein ACNA8J_05240 [Gammaproteobacteria bacterium]
MTPSERSLKVMLLVMIAALGLSIPPTVAAEPRFEVTPFMAYRLGGQFKTDEPANGGAGRTDVKNGAGWGLDLGLYRDAESYYQFLYSRRDAGLDTDDAALRGIDVRIEYFQLGGTLLLPQAAGHAGYISLTIGLTRLAALSGPYGSEHEFSASLGGGFRYPFTDRLHANVGVRGYATFVDRNTDLVCISDGGQAGCLLRSSGRTLWEVEGHAGLAFRF